VAGVGEDLSAKAARGVNVDGRVVQVPVHGVVDEEDPEGEDADGVEVVPVCLGVPATERRGKKVRHGRYKIDLG
jgi:hypothetical protein